MWRAITLLIVAAHSWQPSAAQMEESLCVGRCGGIIVDFTTPNLAPLCSCQATCDSNGIKCCDGANAACNKQWNNFDPTLSCVDMGGCGKTGISNNDGYCRCDAMCVFEAVPEFAVNPNSTSPLSNECCNDMFDCKEYTIVDLPCACSYDCLLINNCCPDLEEIISPELVCCGSDVETCPYALPLPSLPEGCPDDQLKFIFMIKPDRNPGQITWTLKQTQDSVNNTLNNIVGEGDARFGILVDIAGSTFQLSYAEFTGLIVGAAQNMPMQLHAVTSGLACLGPGTYQFQTHDPNGFYTNENGRGAIGLLIENSTDSSKNDLFLFAPNTMTQPEITLQFSIVPSEDSSTKSVALAADPCSLTDAFIDCDGNCYSNVFLSSLGDGICDLGTIPGSPNLFCAERFYDFNDCYNPTLFGFPSGLPPPPTPLLSYALDSASVNKTFEGVSSDPTLSLQPGMLFQNADIVPDEDFGRDVLSCQAPQGAAQIPTDFFPSTGPFSISIWFKMQPGSLNSAFHYMLSLGTSAVPLQNNFHVFFPGILESSYGMLRTAFSNALKPSGAFNFLDTDGLTSNTGLFIGTRKTWNHPNFEDGNWHMYTFVSELFNQYYHYIDGRLFGSFPQGPGPFDPEFPMTLCARTDANPNRAWFGRLSGFKLYDKALFPTEVYSEYLASRPGGPPSEPIGCDGVPGSGRDYDDQCGVCEGQGVFPIPAPKSAGVSDDDTFACCKPLFTVSGQNSPSIVDVLQIVNHLANKSTFQFDSTNPCAMIAADVTRDGAVDVADVLALLDKIAAA